MRYRRNYVQGGTYFFTVNLLDRKCSLLIDYIEHLRASVRDVKEKRPFHINAWVVLPEHMHAIWTLPSYDSDYSSRWRDIKKKFSSSLPKSLDASLTHAHKGERGIWQRRFWEHTIRNDEDYNQHIDYVHFNPVKHGYVNHPKDWPFSSYHRFNAESMQRVLVNEQS